MYAIGYVLTKDNELEKNFVGQGEHPYKPIRLKAIRFNHLYSSTANKLQSLRRKLGL